MVEFSRLPILKDVILIRPRRFQDARGFFCETYNIRDFADAGIDDVFVQDNMSLTTKVGTVRGLHFQTAPHAQSKLVRCTRGRVLDVMVDIRPASRTFGQHDKLELSADDGAQVFIPAGFAHGFCTLEPNTEVAYKVSEIYSPAHEAGIAFDDPELSIAWPYPDGEITLSDKDRALPSFAALRDAMAATGEGVNG